MANLDEDVLRHIFDYLDTPLEWIQVSQVCQLWKRAAEKQWRKISKITYLETEFKYVEKNDPPPEISEEVVEKLLHYAAPFVQILRGTVFFDGKEKLVLFGSFLCKVKGLKSDVILKQLAQEAKNITEICFDRPPKAQLLNPLIRKNKITKVKFLKCYGFYQNVSTDDIEELNVCFKNIGDIRSFAGHFPNLKTFNLTVQCHISIRVQRMLSQILPYVLGVTSLYLTVKSIHGVYRSESEDILFDVSRFSQLEKLSLCFNMYVMPVHNFLNKLATGCLKLREFEFAGPKRSERELLALLTLPCLKILNLDCASDFRTIVLPEITNLTQFRMEYSFENLNVTTFCNVLKMMPELEFLEMSPDCSSLLKLRKDETLRLICGLATVAMTQGKDFIVSSDEIFSTQKALQRLGICRKIPPTNVTKLRIARKITESSNSETSTWYLYVNKAEIDEASIGSIKTFVKNNSGNLYSVRVEVDKQE